MRIRKKVVLSLVTAVFFVTSSAEATLLSTLIKGGSIQVGDKLFNNWLVDTNSISNDITGRTGVDLANIDVTGDNTRPLNPKLIFSVLNDELSIVQSGAIGADLSLAFQFDVTVLNPNLYWHDISLSAEFIEGGSPSINNREAHVHEFLYTDSTLTTLFDSLDSHLIIDDGALPFGDDSGVVFSSEFGPRVFGTVLKDIDLSTEIDGEWVGISSLTQGFSQVPEPSTLAIFALGIAGLVSRRFKK
jgi:hypothetical protein